MKNKINRYYKSKLYFIKLSCNTLLGLLFSLKLSATTFTVTNTSDNNFTPPYTPNTLRWAIYNAVSDANLGNNAVISFNANGLCQIQDYLPSVNHTQGSISFEKAQGSISPQGWEVVAPISNVFGVLNFNNGANSSVQFSNISISRSSFLNGFSNKSHLSSNNLNNVVFDHCNFYGHYFAIQFLEGSTLTISNCTFSNLENGVMSMGTPGNHWNLVNITNNIFYLNSGMQTGIHFCPQSTAAPCTFNLNNNSFLSSNGTTFESLQAYINENDQMNISNNLFYGRVELIRFGNSLSSNETVTFTNNQLINVSNLAALQFYSPLNHWVCTNNSFQNNRNDISISLNSSNTSTRECGLSLIDANTLGYPVQNAGNVFLTHNSVYPSIIVFPLSSTERLANKIIGLNLKGYVECHNNFNFPNGGSSIIRQNKIVSNHWVDVPINLTGNANAGNEKPTITLAQLGGTSLTINYNLTNLNTAGQPNFVVDFYKSNANGDLVSYLGNSGNLSYTTINGPHISTLSVSGLSLTDRIAATVTSYPNVLPLVDFGTSHASYPNSLTPAPIICDYNDPCSPINISCYDNNLNIQLPNCPLLNVWYIFNPNGDAACEATINFNSQINKFNLVSQWINLNQNQPCSTLGSPFFTTTSGLGLNYNFTTNQISAGNNIIQIQLAGVPVPGQPNLYSYNLLADGYSRCSNCPQPPCETCIGSFAPEPTVDPLKPSEYIVSAWARKDGASSTITNFTDPRIKIFFNVGSPVFVNTSGPVIDGWQKLYAKFLIPIGANKINVELDCVSGNCLFDDVRIFPAKGMMKSYVYDPKSMRFVAELDEENYASFFEYDEEGKLTTVKKETVRGIMTIKESRSKIVKQ